MKKFLIVLTVIIAAFSAVFISNAVSNSKVEITRYTVRSDKLPQNFDGYRIAFITDFHNAEFYDKAAECVRSISPDVIIFGGDMINVNEQDCKNTKKLITSISDIAPIYMVSGNHEIFNPEWKSRIEGELKGLGVNIADISDFSLVRGRESIHVYGMQDPAVSDAELSGGSWSDRWADMAGEAYDPKRFNILLCHRANYFPRLSGYNYELVLAGHMHGGLWQLPWVGGMISPDRTTFFPDYTAGLYEENGTKMIVSRGCDKDSSRTRLFNPPEIVCVTLKTTPRS